MLQAILTALSQSKSLVVDLSGLESVDTAGAQLLLSVRRTSLESPQRLSCQGLSESIKSKLITLGLDPEALFTPTKSKQI